jgi:hypothetical protein
LVAYIAYVASRTSLCGGGMNLLDLARSAVASNDAPARQWRVVYSNSPAMTVVFVPAVTGAEVAKLYPHASIDPLPDAETRAATPAEADELRRLVNAILAEDSNADRAEALAIALANPIAALDCYRNLCTGIGEKTS